MDLMKEVAPSDRLGFDYPGFDYEEAFSRNIGWVTEIEQSSLRDKRVAIAGLGGVGGLHLLTLARLGIGSFRIAEFDRYEIANFNRQVGATMASLDRPKLDVMREMALAINPTLTIEAFDRGVDESNIDAFLERVDLFIDGFDFFVLDIRAKVFRRCRELGIPAITAAPLGFGVAYLLFTPEGMSFDDYFRLEGLSQEEQYINFLIGLTPKAPHRHYLVDPTRLDLANKKGPSTGAACQLCAGVVGTEAVKLLLGRGPRRAAPAYQIFDAYQMRWYRGRLPFGNANPLQRFKRRAIEKQMRGAILQAAARSVPPGASEIERILDLARWAPSGDNSQPWRFEITGEDALTVHIALDDNVYEFDRARPTLLSAGMLLETLRLAASRQGRMVSWELRTETATALTIDVGLPRAPGVEPDPLADHILARSVDRGPYKTTPLSSTAKAALEAALGDDLRLDWFESLGERWRMARLNGQASDIRLRIPEAFVVHQQIIDWDRTLSAAGIPDSAIGLDAGTLKIMRWALGDWRRMARLNRLPAPTLAARVQLDYLPGLACGAHFAVSLEGLETLRADDPAALLQTGERLQAFWLEATRQGLVLQPAMAPLCFAYYGRHAAAFTGDAAMRDKATRLARDLGDLHGAPADLLFLGRIGRPRSPAPGPRSTRRPLADMMIREGAVQGEDRAEPGREQAARATR